MLCIMHELGLHRKPDGTLDTAAFKIVYVAPMKVGVLSAGCLCVSLFFGLRAVVCSELLPPPHRSHRGLCCCRVTHLIIVF
jgi:hypothetical protein